MGRRPRHGASKLRTARIAHPRRLQGSAFAAAGEAHGGPAPDHRGWLVLAIEGEVDILVGWLVPDLVRRGTALLVFDLHDVTFMDARGLGVIAETQRQAVAAGGCVRLAAPSHQARRLLALTGSEGAFPLFDSVEQAVWTPFNPIGDDAS
jgi:stage II sporulation protein AA (anti-sigma F factor antagonist)